MTYDTAADLATLSHDTDATLRRLMNLVDDEAAALYAISPRSDAFERREYATAILRDAVEAMDRAAALISAARDV
jgi:hypothetical protein